jgi:hypothetical protein
MREVMATAGETVRLDAPSTWAQRAVRDIPTDPATQEMGTPTVVVRTGRGRGPSSGQGRPLGRGIWVDRGVVQFRSACASGVDLSVRASDETVTVAADWRPSPQEAALHGLLRQRARLLAADVVLHYPAMWRAGWRGRAPLHAAALVVRDRGVLVVGPSGVGKTTLARAEVAAGAALVSDNLVVCDGETVWGVLEPIRAEDGDGPRTTHRRRLVSVGRRRTRHTSVDLVLVLRRDGARTSRRALTSPEAAREIVASTYGAGELRRYWGFTAALAAGTGRGPAHPGVGLVADQICAGATCVELHLGDRPAARIGEVIDSLEVLPWT